MNLICYLPQKQLVFRENWSYFLRHASYLWLWSWRRWKWLFIWNSSSSSDEKSSYRLIILLFLFFPEWQVKISRFLYLRRSRLHSSQSHYNYIIINGDGVFSKNSSNHLNFFWNLEASVESTNKKPPKYKKWQKLWFNEFFFSKYLTFSFDFDTLILTGHWVLCLFTSPMYRDGSN